MWKEERRGKINVDIKEGVQKEFGMQRGGGRRKW